MLKIVYFIFLLFATYSCLRFGYDTRALQKFYVSAKSVRIGDPFWNELAQMRDKLYLVQRKRNKKFMQAILYLFFVLILIILIII